MVESNNQQVNTFLKGMNLDLSNALLPEDSYREAYNLRVTTDQNSNSGVLHNIEGVKFDMNFVIPGGKTWTVIDTITIRNYGLILARHKTTGKITMFRFEHKAENTTAFKQILGGTSGITMPLGANISIVTRYEDETNIKIYIADGENQVRSFNVAPSNDFFNTRLTNDDSASIYPAVTFAPIKFHGFGNGRLKAGVVQYGYQLFNRNGAETEISPLTNLIAIFDGPINPSNLGEVNGLSEGKMSNKSVKLSLKRGMITTDYTRVKIIGVYYAKRGDLPTIKILTDLPFNSDITYEDKTGAGIGEMSLEEFQMVTNLHFSPAILESKNNYLFASRVQYKDSPASKLKYDARAYRFYQSSLSTPETNITVLHNTNGRINFTASQADIMSGKVRIYEDSDCVNPFNDTNISQSLFHKEDYDKLNGAAKSRYDLYPCATYVNSQGQTVYGGIGPNVEYSFIVADIGESLSDGAWDDAEIAQLNVPYYRAGDPTMEIVWVSNVLKSKDVQQVHVNIRGTSGMYWNNADVYGLSNYANSVISHNYTSLQRDEVYRYGAILYDKFGKASTVNWIGDIRTPSMCDRGFETFASNRRVGYRTDSNRHEGYELAVRPIGITFKLSNLPPDVVAYEIVRCERTAEDRSIISQGLVYKLMQGTDVHAPSHLNKVYPPVFPACSSLYSQGEQVPDTVWHGWLNPYYGFVSPEVVYTKEVFDQLVQGSDLKIETKKVVSSVIKGDVGHTRVAVSPSSDSGEVIPSPEDSKLWSITNSYKGENAHLVFRYFSQSNKYVSHHSPPTAPTYVSVGDSFEISSMGSTTDIPWSGYDRRDDYFDSFATTLYRNWVLMSLTGADGRDEGANGRTFVFSSPAFSGSGKVGNIVKAANILRSLNGSISSALYYDSNLHESVETRTKAGLFICNLKKNVIPYGGNTYVSRQFSTYITCGGYNYDPRKRPSIDVFGGDTFIGIFEWCKTHYMTSTDNKAYNVPTFVYVPLESSINLSLTHGPEYHKKRNKYVQCEPGNINNKYIQDKPLYSYNTVYSTQPSAKFHTAKKEFSEFNSTVDVRTYHSEPKTNRELIDSWTKFKPFNYLDVDTRYGKITNLRAFGNELIFWQEHAIGKFSVLERTMITDDSNSPLLLGTGGVLSRYDYIGTNSGLMLNQNDCDSQSDTTLYWFDQARQELCAYSYMGLDPISKSKYVHSYVRRLCIEKSKLRTKPFVSYDRFYNELLCFLSTEDTLVYNENLRVFTSFYTLVPDYTLMFGKEMYMLKNNSLYKYNSDTINLGFDGNTLPIELKWVVNKDYVHTKVFDNVDFSGLLNKEHITKITFNTETLLGSDITPADITDRELNYRFAVPRVKTNASYPNRLRGKYLECRMSYNLVGQSNVLLVSHVDEYLNTYDDKQLIANKPAKNGTQVVRDLNYYTIDNSLTETFELPYIRTTYRVSKS